MSETAPPVDDLLRRLRDEGFRVRAEGDRLTVAPVSDLDPALRERVREAKPALVEALRREQAERALGLVPVDPETGLPDLPDDEPATERQVERLRQLASRPAWDGDREDVREIVEDAIDGGISRLGAYGLILELGGRIARRRRRGEGARS